MAIQKDLKLVNGLETKGAYIRIDTVSGYKGGIDISVNSYVSEEAFKNGKPYLAQQLFHFAPSVENGSTNFIAQGYAHLKTLPEFADAIDC